MSTYVGCADWQARCVVESATNARGRPACLARSVGKQETIEQNAHKQAAKDHKDGGRGRGLLDVHARVINGQKMS